MSLSIVSSLITTTTPAVIGVASTFGLRVTRRLLSTSTTKSFLEQNTVTSSSDAPIDSQEPHIHSFAEYRKIAKQFGPLNASHNAPKAEAHDAANISPQFIEAAKRTEYNEEEYDL